MKTLLLPWMFLASFQAQGAQAPPPAGSRVVKLTASDMLPITAEVHSASEDPRTPFLILLHDSHSSRGEYREIVPRLRRMGFNTMSVDLRVGGKCKQVKNATARAAGMLSSVKRADALRDIDAAVEYARANEAHGKLLLWGSAYSASLAFVEAAKRPDLVDGVIAFAPGEYFAEEGPSATWIRDTAAEVACPVFLASDQGSESDWSPIFASLPGEQKESFVPKQGGRHGSSSLWAEVKESEEYWKALAAFLDRYFPRTPAASEPAGSEPAGSEKGSEEPRDG